jgi:cell division protein FtsQ
MAQRTSKAATKSGTTRTPKASPAPQGRTPVTLAPPSAAARRRINQRRRQQITRRVRSLEAVLPSIGGGVWRPSWPAFGDWPDWRDGLARLRTRSFVLLAAALIVLAGLVTWVHTDERWFLYREDARFDGLTYLDADELWQMSQIESWNLFWLDTAAVRARLLQNPYVADADVYVSPLEGAVHLDITEAQPVALWLTDNGTRWLLPGGAAVEPRGTTPAGLLQIVDGGAGATAPGAALGGAIDLAVLASARSLAEHLPGGQPLRYNRQIGLNFQLQDKPYWVYWGDGSNVERKLENLAAAVQLLEAGTLEGTVIDVRFERPYVK